MGMSNDRLSVAAAGMAGLESTAWLVGARTGTVTLRGGGEGRAFEDEEWTGMTGVLGRDEVLDRMSDATCCTFLAPDLMSCSSLCMPTMFAQKVAMVQQQEMTAYAAFMRSARRPRAESCMSEKTLSSAIVTPPTSSIMTAVLSNMAALSLHGTVRSHETNRAE